MNKYAPEIASLRLDIEQSVKRKIRTPYDFEFLSGVIWERLHENISPTTLKRLWGYIEGADTTRRTTYHPSSAYHPLNSCWRQQSRSSTSHGMNANLNSNALKP